MLPTICGIGGDPGYRAVLRFSAAAHLWTERSVQVSVESGAQPISLRSVELLRLSTHFEYDGENLREVTGPDGARQRVEHDRLGRPQVWMAADGTWVQCVYDSLDRPIRLLDSEGVEQRYEFAAVGNLNSFRLVFREATQNADAIRVELSRWEPGHRYGIFEKECQIVVGNVTLYNKSIFVGNGTIMDGRDFVERHMQR